MRSASGRLFGRSRSIVKWAGLIGPAFRRSTPIYGRMLRSAPYLSKKLTRPLRTKDGGACRHHMVVADVGFFRLALRGNTGGPPGALKKTPGPPPHKGARTHSGPPRPPFFHTNPHRRSESACGVRVSGLSPS